MNFIVYLIIGSVLHITLHDNSIGDNSIIPIVLDILLWPITLLFTIVSHIE